MISAKTRRYFPTELSLGFNGMIPVPMQQHICLEHNTDESFPHRRDQVLYYHAVKRVHLRYLNHAVLTGVLTADDCIFYVGIFS